MTSRASNALAATTATHERVAYSIAEVECKLGLCHTSVQRLINSGALVSFRIGRRRMVSAHALASFISKSERDGHTPLPHG